MPPKILTIKHEHDPGCTNLIASGWTGNYHVISENPEDGDLSYEHSFHSKEYIRAHFKDPLLDEFLKPQEEL